MNWINQNAPAVVAVLALAFGGLCFTILCMALGPVLVSKIQTVLRKWLGIDDAPLKAEIMKLQIDVRELQRELERLSDQPTQPDRTTIRPRSWADYQRAVRS